MILLDDAQSTAASPSSRLYQNALSSWSAKEQINASATLVEIDTCLEAIQEALARGEYLVAAFSYELGNYLHKIPPRNTEDQASRCRTLIQAWSYSSFESLSKDQVNQFLSQEIYAHDGLPSISGIANLNTSLDEQQFRSDIKKIQEYILNGDCYQINHTYRIFGQVYGKPLALYSRLRERQPGRFGAYIDDGSHCILSQSPELFIERHGDTFKAMPMKGTANAITESPDGLSNDAKNQAENVMIVDLLRNDLSRLSLPGTVTVPNLFEVARHGNVLQMTSTVQAQARPNIQLGDVLNAVFPCGSVTGAPKKRSMEIIRELESSDRGYYCGALGWLDPNGDFAFSVPIRTLEVDLNSETQSAQFTMGVGAGITIDSEANQEWQECHIKAAFLSSLPSSVGLFETILIKNGAPQNLQLHLERLHKSARALNIPLDTNRATNNIKDAIAACAPHSLYRFRLNLSTAGEMSHELNEIEPLTESVKIFWAKDILPNPEMSVLHSGNILLSHKVNSRDAYDLAWNIAQTLGGFDALFTNEQGFVTEGGRTSIFIRSDDEKRWLTPPLSAGVLPGIMRSIILSDPTWNAHEANLTIDDIKNAKEIMLSNALRGMIPAHF